MGGANQMALQLRLITWHMRWASTVFMLRYAPANTLAACKALGLVDPAATMCELQLDIIRRPYFGGQSVVH